jgi:hypothetical protein
VVFLQKISPADDFRQNLSGMSFPSSFSRKGKKTEAAPVHPRAASEVLAKAEKRKN